MKSSSIFQLGESALLIGVLTAAIWFVAGADGLVMSGLAALILFAERFRRVLFAIGTLTFWLLAPPLWRGADGYQPSSDVEVILQRLLVLTLICALGLALMGRASRRVLGAFMVVSFLVFGFYRTPVIESQFISATVDLFLGAFKYFVFPLGFLTLMDARPVGVKAKMQSLLLALPFWTVGTITPVINGSDQGVLAKTLGDPIPMDRKLESLRSAARLSVIVAVTQLAVVMSQFLFFGGTETKIGSRHFISPFSFNLGIWDLNQGFDEVVSGMYSSVAVWASVVVTFIFAYARLTIFLNVMVVCARLAGFQMPSSFQAPWRAKSFGDFYGRIIFYYGNIIAHLYVPVFKETLTWLRNRSLRAQFALLLALFLGGFHLHFIRDYRRVYSDGFLHTLMVYSPTAFYFLILALLIVVSSRVRRYYLQRRGRESESMSFLGRSVRVLTYTVVWSVVYSSFVATYHTPTTFETYSAFLRRLFFID